MIARSAHRFRIINIVAAITVAALIAASCGSDDATATPEPVTETTTTVNQPTTTVEAVEEPLAVTTTTTTVVALTEDQVAEIQQEIAEEAAPESELSLADCTAWIADPEIVLTDQQASECDAMLAAVAESCVGMDCPGDDSTEPEETETPVTTLPPQEEEPEPEPEPTTTTTAPQPEPEPEPTTTTTAPEPEPTTTTTAPEPEPEPEPPTLVVDPVVVSEGLNTFTITGANFDPSLTIWTLLCPLPGASLSPDSPADQVAAAMASVATADCDLTTARSVDVASDGSFATERDANVYANFMWAAGDADETQTAGAAVFLEVVAQPVDPEVARYNEEVTLYNEFVASVQQGQTWTDPEPPTVHPDTPQTSWDRGTHEVGSRPDDRPRVTANVKVWMDWCGGHPRCDQLLRYMVWALDYLGANEVCVIEQYFDYALSTAEYPEATYGWHNCATIIDPMQPDGRLLSEHTPSMAERCRAVLPEDVELEERINRGVIRDGLDCDEWGAWVEARRTSYPACDRSARLAEEWLEHYIGMPERYWRMSC